MRYYLLLLMLSFSLAIFAQEKSPALFPVQGFCIGGPSVGDVDRFVKFIDEELAPRHVNTLIVRIDYNYSYTSHPELRGENPLTEKDVKKMVAVCKKHSIRLIPQVNLLGHQSWHSKATKLLEVYPQFDENPEVKLPEEYKWPNADGLYCKSYCPLHPEVHGVVFDIVDEICNVFETDAFHAGMDEVFYIGNDKCPRCSGRDKAELFAGEVTLIRNHLAAKNRELWIWGDRMIDGKTTGLGMWEASMNNTHRAIDMIPKDVFICDWHYERPDQTAVLFAMKGFKVATCPWRTPEIGVQQVEDMARFRESATKATKDNFAGMIQTVWSGAGPFMDEYYGVKKNESAGNKTPTSCFKSIYAKMNEMAKE